MAEVASAYFTLLPSVKGLQGAIAKEVSGVDGKSAGASVGKSMGSSMAHSIKSIVGPAVLALGAVKAFGFAKDAVSSFSELEDSSAAASVTFSGNMDRITALSKTASTSIGLDSQQVVSSAQMFGIFGKAAGLAGEDLETFAVDMTNLTGDLSSFSGKPVEDAITAVGAAMRGEFEPIRSFGVLLNDATLREEALRMGLIKSTKEALTPQNKTLAARSAILKQTKDAQGDFARTSQSTANVQKTLAAESQNLSMKLGSVLAPAFTAVRLKMLDGVRGADGFVNKFVTMVPRIGMAWTGLQDLFLKGDFKGKGGLGQALGIQEDDPIVDTLFTIREVAVGLFDGLSASVGPLIPTMAELWSTISPLGTIFQVIQPFLMPLLDAFFQLASVVGGSLVQAVSGILPSLQVLQGTFISLFQDVLSVVLPVVLQLVGMFSQTLSQLVPILIPIISTVVSLAATLISQLAPIFMELVTAILPMAVSILGSVLGAIGPVVQEIAGFLIPIIQALLPVVVTVFQTVANVIRSVMQIVQGIIQVVTGVISGNWSQVWTGIGNVLSGIWNLIVSVIRGALAVIGQVVISGVNLAVDFLRSAFQGVASFLGGIWSNITSGVSGMIGRVAGFFGGLIGKITGAIGNAGGALLQTGKDIVQGLIDGIGSMMGAIGRAVLSIVPEAIRGPFEDLMGIRSPSRVAIWWGEMITGGLASSIANGVGKVAAATAKLVPALPGEALAMAGSRYSYDVSGAPAPEGGFTQIINPREGQSEESIGEISARKILRRSK